jgi:hypothetical protein
MGFFFRTLRMVDHGIKPAYVFDGKPPELKGGVVGLLDVTSCGEFGTNGECIVLDSLRNDLLREMPLEKLKRKQKRRVCMFDICGK